MKQADLQAVRAQRLIKLREQLGELGHIWFPSCIDCVYFDEKRELCTKDNCNARPPARVIAYGCSAFDTIPF